MKSGSPAEVLVQRYATMNQALDARRDDQRVVLLDGQPYVASERLVAQLEAQGAAWRGVAFDGREVWHIDAALM